MMESDAQKFLDWLRSESPEEMTRFQGMADQVGESIDEFLIRALESFLFAYTQIAGCPCWRCRVAELAERN